MTTYSEEMIKEEYDLAGSPSGWPDIRYAIVGSPRSGSNLLCDYLTQLGLGVPMEYMSRWTVEKLPTRLGAWTPTDYGNVLLGRRTSSIIGVDGRPTTTVFGVKTLRPYEWQRAQTFIWPNWIIRLFREEKEPQVLSYAKARASEDYVLWDGDEHPPEPEAPTPEELVSSENIIMQLEQFWNQAAAESNVAFSYEYLAEKPKELLQHIVDEVFEVDVTIPDDITPRIRKQT